MATMERRKTLTMNWDGLGEDDDDDHFFETYNRLSIAAPLDLDDENDNDENFDDSRMSFASAISSIHSSKFRTVSRMERMSVEPSAPPNYDIWMAAPESITERRRRLLGSMGLDENKEFLKATSAALDCAITKKFEKGRDNEEKRTRCGSDSATTTGSSVSGEQKTEHSPVSYALVRSRSEGEIDMFSVAKARKEEMIGKVSKQRLTRTSTEIVLPCARMIPYVDGSKEVTKEACEAGESRRHGHKLSGAAASSGVRAFFLIKNLDTGKEFIVNEYGEDGNWNRLSDLQTGKQLTMEEFENTVGHSAIVKELMRRAKVARGDGYGKKLSSNSYISRSLRLSKRRGASLLKNIKGVASGFVGEREREVPIQQQQGLEPKPPGKNDWVRVRQSGKSQKEFSALHLCQEFQAHEGCIWTIKFSLDGHYLASAGEDKVIHVWEVQECEVLSLKPEEGNLTPIHPSLLSSMERSGQVEASPLSSEKKKKGKIGSKRGNTIPDYVHVPETVFTLSERPYCSFIGHQDEVLDLSWSRSQLLLSSSMDKTVRLWDLETKTCLKFFAHNDYVPCIHFNPMDDDFFISGSLDAKVRIWNIPSRHVVDWTDIHEMVTAVSYMPDGHGVLVGTQKGSCRTYSIEDSKLIPTGTIEMNKKKSQLKKITGFQFTPCNPSEVLVTSADSRIRIVDGSDVVHKFKGFRNTDSQIAATFSPDGRYIISASEDSQVYVWKHGEPRNTSSGKGKNVLITQSHEHFQCKDVSIAIPWPCIVRGDPPPVPVHQSKRHSKHSSTAQANCGDDTTSGANSKRMLPPLPKKGKNHATESDLTSPPEEDSAAISHTETGTGDSFSNSKRMLPPLPKKSNHQATGSDFSSIEEDLEAISRTDSGLVDSFTAGSASIRYGDSPSISAATTPSFDSSFGTSTTHPSAWGLVIVTASFGGEIRCYQNFGLPRRISRQPNLFGSPT